LIAIFDHSENKVVIIGDKIYRLSLDEFGAIKPALESKGLMIIGDNINPQSSASVSSFSRPFNNLEAEPKVRTESLPVSQKDYVTSVKGKCVIVNGLDPKLQFMGLDDFKSVDQLVQMYGKMPDEVKGLLKNGLLVLIDEEEKQSRISKMKEKQKVKGRSVQKSSSQSIRFSEDSSSEDDSGSEDQEDRMLRNAVKIDL
jgi:hypothetical protein